MNMPCVGGSLVDGKQIPSLEGGSVWQTANGIELSLKDVGIPNSELKKYDLIS